MKRAGRCLIALAISPDSRTLVGIIRNTHIQDASAGATALLRIVTIDIRWGRTTHQFRYLLTMGSGISELVAVNDHEFPVDQRDGKGRVDGSRAKVKQLFKIGFAGAEDTSAMGGATAALHVVNKTLFIGYPCSAHEERNKYCGNPSED